MASGAGWDRPGFAVCGSGGSLGACWSVHLLPSAVCALVGLMGARCDAQEPSQAIKSCFIDARHESYPIAMQRPAQRQRRDLSTSSVLKRPQAAVSAVAYPHWTTQFPVSVPLWRWRYLAQWPGMATLLTVKQ
ncbi:hypothetical protein EJ06DRAFT_142360 [Trichodelitschia bisporula]|uniref:Uncharacterized protein n=1 Tax=Trichodelitschia bisporula TaxID=703511 RepID=A0A6G1HPA2_9PEZI|nr:hypothetical protein EJ06DRAFT_142360 [Trichodelitschia bisporula]